MEQQKTETRSITAEQRKRVEEVCFRSLALIGRNCEYLEQHFDRTGADASTRQAVADIDTAAMQLDRTLSEAITLLEFLDEDTVLAERGRSCTPLTCVSFCSRWRRSLI